MAQMRGRFCGTDTKSSHMLGGDRGGAELHVQYAPSLVLSPLWLRVRQ
jgi:hypothetical protein